MIRRTRFPLPAPLRSPILTLSVDGGLRLAILGAVGWLPTAVMAGPVFGTPGWFAQAQQTAAGPVVPAASAAPVINAGSVATPMAAQTLAARSMADLGRAAAAIVAAQKAQLAAAQVAAANSLPTGLSTGGLQVAAGVAGHGAGCAASFTCLWQNADLPTQAVGSDGKTTVTINQTAKKAILSWDSFNVSADTILHFDQHLGTQGDGNNDWVALNRVGAGASMSRIYGQIQADGSVYLINPNGILFGAGSKVNVHSLLASSLPLYLPLNSASLTPGDDPAYLAQSNRLFLTSGLNTVGQGTANGNILGIGSGGVQSLAANSAANQLILPGEVETEAGARIEVSKLGYALLAAPTVNNAGYIRAVDGQVILAAGLGVALKNPASGSQLLTPVVSGRLVDADHGNADVTPVTTLTNTGLLEAVRGDARLLAANVVQDGVVAATSSVSRPGSISVSAMDEQATDSSQARTGSAVLTGRSVTAMLPDGNGETTISTAAATQSFQPGSIAVSGAAVTLQAEALVEAPGQKVTLAAVSQDDALIAPRALKDGAVAGRVYIDRDATVDVAGIADIRLAMNDNLVTIARLGLNELADSPLQRDSVLYGAAVVIDSRLSGTRDDGVNWVGTPVANLSGYVDQIARNINQMLLNGGTVTLAGNEVLAQSGSHLNLDGGYVHYLGGLVQTTRLLSANGTLVDIGAADPFGAYVGIAGLMADKNSRWNLTSTYYSPLLSGGAGSAVYESDYLKGGNAGVLNVLGLSAAVLSGDVSAQGLSGRYQVGNAKPAAGGTLNLGAGNNSALLNLTLPSPTAALPAGRSYVVVSDARTLNERVDGTFTATTVLPAATAAADDTANLSRWTEVSAKLVKDGGFSNLNVLADDPASTVPGGEIVVKADAALSVRDGGGISLTGSRIRVDGDVSARSGKISLTGTGRTWLAGTTTADTASDGPLAGDIIIGGSAVLDASGRWVNDSGRDADSIDGAAVLNGGAISLVTRQSAMTAGGSVTDTTGSIRLEKGSLLNVASGGRVLPSGKVAMKDNVALGKGGDISLQTYVPTQLPFGGDGAPGLPTDEPVSRGRLVLDGDLRAYGFAGGGSLNLRALGIQIGGSAPADQPWVLTLPESWFAGTGFGSVQLQAEYNAEVAPLAKVNLSQNSFLLNDLLSPTLAATGTDLATAGFLHIGRQDDYHRQAVNFALYGGDYATWHTAALGGTPPDYSADGITGAVTLGKNAVISADAGANIVLGSHTQVTVDGTITAHGGSITLTGDTARGGYAQNPGLIVNGNAWTSDNKSVWLGANTLLDVSGTVLQDPYAGKAGFTVASAGKVLDGGTITLSNDTGYVIALNCLDSGECSGDTAARAARLNVSGAAGSLLTASVTGSQWKPRAVAGNAGVIRLGASKGLYFHGDMQGQAGSAATEGGALEIRPLTGRLQTAEDFAGATALSLSAKAIAMPEGAKLPGQSDTLIEEDGPTGVLHFATDSLKNSGISRLHLGVDPTLNTAAAPLPTLVTENIDLTLGRELLINTSVIRGPATSITVEVNEETGDQTGKVIFNTPSITINLDAPYVGLSGLQYGGNYPQYFATDDFNNVIPTDVDGNPLLTAAFARDYTARDVFRYKDEDRIITVYAPTTDDSGDTSGSDLLPLFYRSTLNINADNMDIGGQFLADGFAKVNLGATQDMRFVTPSTYDYLRDPANPAKASAIPGSLMTTADLTLTAGQLYPASGNKFVLTALGHSLSHVEADDPTDPETSYTQYTETTGGSITIKGTGAKTVTPLSAGGSLIFNAATISQQGVIRAPAGEIVLGAGISATDGEAQSLLRYNAISLDGSTLSVQMPVMATTSVTLAKDSLTSVSLDGLTVPYGVTADEQNLQYNGSVYSGAGAATSSAVLTSSPDKQIRVQGGTVKLVSGAVVNLTGDGDLLAQEWVAGTGGSRDVLSAYNTSYATGSAVKAPLYKDGRTVYAVLPGKQSALAAYDPQLTGDPLIGKAVWLSGVPGLAAGLYTLLPARYAVLPGAFRVVQDTAVTDALAQDNRLLADGTVRVAGYFADSFTKHRDSRNSAFLVQSEQAWRQYSQYSLTSLNQYFGGSEGNAAILPEDAGKLILQAGSSLSLGARLAAGSKHGLGAELDIAAPRLQIADHDVAALGGYVKLDASELNTLGVSRLVLGGVSTRTAEGDLLRAVANAVVIDTAKDGLRAPEILALAQTPAATDEMPEPAPGVVTVKTGSRLIASGSGGRQRNAAIQVGLLPDSDENGNDIDGASGDGALLRLSAGGAVAVSRVNVPGVDGEGDVATGLLTIGDNVSLRADGSVTLDAAGNTVIAPTVAVSAKSFDANSALVVMTGRASSTQPAAGLVVGPQLLAQLAGIDDIALRSRGELRLDGDFALVTSGRLTLSAATVISDGGQASLKAGQLTLANQLEGEPDDSISGLGQLTLNADRLILGDGNLRFSGLRALNINATQGMLGAGVGGLDAGDARLTLQTPLIAAATGSNITLRTNDQLVAGAQGAVTPTVASGAGGKLALTASSIDFNTAAVATSGKISLTTPGGLALGDHAKLDTGGSTAVLYGKESSTPGGVLELTSDGILDIFSGAVLAFGASGQGQGGALRIRAGGERLGLAGQLQGQGGDFSLDSATAVDLDSLAARLDGGRVNGELDIITHSGDLTLSAGSRLTGQSVVLTATGDRGDQALNPGHVVIDGVVNASGESGGVIRLNGTRGVTVRGSLLAVGSAADQRGGSVQLATSGATNGQLNPDYGYQQVTAADSGVITLGPTAVIDVSGGRAGGLSGGSVDLRAPLLNSGDVRVSLDDGSVIRGARAVTLEAYGVWSTADSSTGAAHFDGVVDAAGRFDSQGKVLAAGAINSDHRDFYSHTLSEFVRDPGFNFGDRFAAVDNFRSRAGVELVNDSAGRNGGDISVLSNWNLGARDEAGLGLYRSADGIAPGLTLRALNNIRVNASLSDGFVQTANLLSPGAALSGNGAAPTGVELASASLAGGDSASFTLTARNGSIRLDGHETVSPVQDQPTADNPDALGRQLVTPTMIRTGVGSIRLQAGQDIVLADSIAPGVIYTAGRPVAAVEAPSLVVTAQGLPLFINAGQTVSEAAGDIRLSAGGNIQGIQKVTDATGKLTGAKNADLSQFWWPWLQNACLVSAAGCAGKNTAGVNFGMFGQGILSTGGNIALTAGGNIRDLSVSLPATWLPSATADGKSAVTVYGGGNLSVDAGRSLLSGSYYVGRGRADIRVGNAVSADLYDSNFNPTATILALQDATINLTAGSYAEIGGIYNPSWLFSGFDGLNYSDRSAVAIQSVGSGVVLNSLTSLPGGSYGTNDDIDSPLTPAYGFVMPAHLGVEALSGTLAIKRNAELYPSADGQLSLMAGGDITLLNRDTNNTYIGLIDADASVLPSPLNPVFTPKTVSFIKYGASSATDLHAANPLHAADSLPVIVYSRDGSLIDGNIFRDYNGAVILSSPKAADIRVGRDIVNLSFSGQNLYDSDITSLAAGRDIINPPLVANQSVPFIELGGPGLLSVQAGRDLGPLTSANEAMAQGYLPRSNPSYPGIRTVGNQNNTWLGRSGAGISLSFGVGLGVETDRFAETYLNPAVLHDPANPADTLGTPDYRQKLVAFVGQWQQDQAARQGNRVTELMNAANQWSVLSPAEQGRYAAQAWSAFTRLGGAQKQALVTSVFLDILNQVGADYNNGDSRFNGQYTRGFAAINTLFPAASGYTENKLSGRYGAEQKIRTGTLDMRGSTVQTQRGGDISIVGPGGRVLVGSTSAPPQVGRSAASAGIGPNNQGILTMERGNIGIFADDSILLAQSRIFTEQGGDLLIWSSNGDINAGKGAKTSSELPPPEYLCDDDHFCLVDAKSQVSGAGIAVLQTKPNSPKGSATLVAPTGTVDFGEAGARISGNLNVAAAKVANASNVQTGGKSVGLPATGADTAALGSGAATAAAASQAADAASDARRKQQQKENPASDFLFEIVRQPGPACDANDPKCRS
ncbi:filamentous hemagglutinin family protein [Fluviicoccus keumensis]|uniref:Filamentous hemagglutinin family protein n=1 Tax=Fluviicoccus keumensis TaxID=1435465 RepID=A0A4Q7ZAM6_9GAMM|nr:filamentous haemagglutinin family protein [Fluviicoccus keumensis]RZU46953.1 filamentous hemagglutinin family protein [Fluviicoccus keumensis]